MSELTATRVPVLSGADVRLVRTHEPARVVGPCLHAGTGQEGVCVEGPLPGRYTYHTLEAFARLFEFQPASHLGGEGVQCTAPAPAVPGRQSVPERAAGHVTQGGGY